MSKRVRTMTGLGIVAALATAGVVAGHVVAVDPEVESLSSAAAALEMADRLQIPSSPDPEPEPEPPPEGKLLFPLAEAELCGVLSNFGEPRNYGGHTGVDIIATAGTAVFNVETGTITQVYTNTGSAGYGWRIETADGTIFRYFHMQEDLGGWQVGDVVPQGAVIGYVGDTGNSPGNYHLHFDYWPNGVPANSYSLLDIPEWCNKW